MFILALCNDLFFSSKLMSLVSLEKWPLELIVLYSLYYVCPPVWPFSIYTEYTLSHMGGVLSRFFRALLLRVLFPNPYYFGGQDLQYSMTVNGSMVFPPDGLGVYSH